MPVMDGIEATRSIRMLPNYKNVPITGVSAGNSLGEKERCLSAGMSDFLSKPVRQEGLFTVITKNIYIDKFISSDLDNLDTSDLIDKKMIQEQLGDDEEFKTFFINLVIQ